MTTTVAIKTPTLASLATRQGKYLTSNAYATAKAKGGKALEKYTESVHDYLRDVESLARPLEEGRTLAGAYAIRLADDRGESSTLTAEQLSERYLMRWDGTFPGKARVSQLRTIARLACDLGFSPDDPEWTVLVSTRPTGYQNKTIAAAIRAKDATKESVLAAYRKVVDALANPAIESKQEESKQEESKQEESKGEESKGEESKGEESKEETKDESKDAGKGPDDTHGSDADAVMGKVVNGQANNVTLIEGMRTLLARLSDVSATDWVALHAFAGEVETLLDTLPSKADGMALLK